MSPALSDCWAGLSRMEILDKAYQGAQGEIIGSQNQKGVSTLKYGWMQKRGSALSKLFSSLPCLIFFFFFFAVFGFIFWYLFPCRGNMATNSFGNFRGKRAPPSQNLLTIPYFTWVSCQCIYHLLSRCPMAGTGKFLVWPRDLWSTHHSLTLCWLGLCIVSVPSETLMDASRIHCWPRRFEDSDDPTQRWLKAKRYWRSRAQCGHPNFYRIPWLWPCAGIRGGVGRGFHSITSPSF